VREWVRRKGGERGGKGKGGKGYKVEAKIRGGRRKLGWGRKEPERWEKRGIGRGGWDQSSDEEHVVKKRKHGGRNKRRAKGE